MAERSAQMTENEENLSSVVSFRRASTPEIPAMSPQDAAAAPPGPAEDDLAAFGEAGETAEAPTLAAQPVPRPHWDPWAPVWLRPLIRVLLLDEHGPMPRTVAAQVGFAAVLMMLQAAVDMLAWTLGLRWVFVDALGPGGWALTIGFAALISLIILIFERFVVTAAVPLDKSPFSNKGTLVRIAVVLAFAMVTAIPVEMMVFHDVIQGRIGSEIESRRISARSQLLGEIDKSQKSLAEEERAARQSVKLELPEPKTEKVDTSELDAQILGEKGKLPRLERYVERDKSRADRFESRRVRAKIRLDALADDAPAATRRRLQSAYSSEARRAQSAASRAAAAADALAGQQRTIAALEEERTRKQGAVEAENERLRKEATDEHQRTLAGISERYTGRRDALEKRRAEVEAMTDLQLAAATKRTFQPPDGFARRWQIMNQLEEEDELFGWTKWAVRVLFVGLSLLVLASKSFFHRRTRAYYLGFDPMDPRIGSL